MTLFKTMLRDQQGTATVQYAFVAVLITLAVMIGSLALGGSLVDLYNDMTNQARAALTDQADAGAPSGSQD